MRPLQRHRQRAERELARVSERGPHRRSTSFDLGVVKNRRMTHQVTCPRCGREFLGDDKLEVAAVVVEHAHGEHGHTLDLDVVLAHLEGVHPHDRGN